MSADMEKRVDGTLRKMQRGVSPSALLVGPVGGDIFRCVGSGAHGLPCAPHAIQAQCPPTEPSGPSQRMNFTDGR